MASIWTADSAPICSWKRVIVECKSKEALHPIDTAQVLSHLRLLQLPLGLLINFNVVVLKDGIRRVANNYQEE